MTTRRRVIRHGFTSRPIDEKQSGNDFAYEVEFLRHCEELGQG